MRMMGVVVSEREGNRAHTSRLVFHLSFPFSGCRFGIGGEAKCSATLQKGHAHDGNENDDYDDDDHDDYGDVDDPPAGLP